MSVPAITVTGLTKHFGAFTANDRIDLSVGRAEIHGIVGENGAGKSTLMKLLYGMHQPDEGTIRIDGAASSFRSPLEAIASGLGMVHQHFMLAGPESALENAVLGAEGPGARAVGLFRSFFPYRRADARKRLQSLAAEMGFEIPWDRPIETLPVGIQQRLEILKLLYRDARILILDEPTAVLTPSETNELFARLRTLREKGKTILVITHKLREVREFTDRYTVLRQGRVTGGGKSGETSEETMAREMVGREISLTTPVKPPVSPSVDRKRPVYSLLSPIPLQIHPGEIVGIAGVEGNGQSELLKAIGIPDHAGRLPEDRIQEGILKSFPLEENLLLSPYWRKKASNRGLIDRDALRDRGGEAIRRFNVRPPDLDAKIGSLSGGNQQKFVFARELEGDPSFLVAAHPTRGVDVGAIEFLHGELLRARARGAGILLVSSELDEVLALSDRILVLFQGKVAAEFTGPGFDVDKIGLAMGGGG